jgi:hypothetical protein
MNATGTFEVTMAGEPPYETIDDVSLGRMTVDKRFSGPLTATSTVQMLAAHTPVEGSAAYVGLERVIGTLDGRAGSFVLQHCGVMTRDTRSLSVTVVPDSGTSELRGLEGEMKIEVVEGQHRYSFEYRLSPS